MGYPTQDSLEISAGAEFFHVLPSVSVVLSSTSEGGELTLMSMFGCRRFRSLISRCMSTLVGVSGRILLHGWPLRPVVASIAFIILIVASGRRTLIILLLAEFMGISVSRG